MKKVEQAGGGHLGFKWFLWLLIIFAFWAKMFFNKLTVKPIYIGSESAVDCVKYE